MSVVLLVRFAVFAISDYCLVLVANCDFRDNKFRRFLLHRRNNTSCCIEQFTQHQHITIIIGIIRTAST